jgi:hypothetical protein
LGVLGVGEVSSGVSGSLGFIPGGVLSLSGFLGESECFSSLSLSQRAGPLRGSPFGSSCTGGCAAESQEADDSTGDVVPGRGEEVGGGSKGRLRAGDTSSQIDAGDGVAVIGEADGTARHREQAEGEAEAQTNDREDSSKGLQCGSLLQNLEMAARASMPRR